MPKAIDSFVHYVEATNTAVGKFSQYLIFGMMAVLLYESISRTLFNRPHIWVVEIAQFTMAAYYLLGGGYSLILDGHVRMDLLYSRWSSRTRAVMDTITGFVMMFYLSILFYGAVSSVEYALRYGQVNYSSWGPPLAPIKIIMAIGIFLMLLQAIVIFIKDLTAARGGAKQ